ncbi:MAG: ABC transporter permease [Desulfurococcus sp.]|nr:ABC transporter permease [Desulfurococcus sp.]
MVLKQLVIREVKSFLKNPVFIASLVILMVFYPSLGSVIKTGVESVREASSLSAGLVIEENTALVSKLVDTLVEYSNGSVKVYSSLPEALKETGVAVLIPRGFTENATSPGRVAVLKGEVRVEDISPISSQARLLILQNIASTISELLPVAVGQLYNITIQPGTRVVVEGSVIMYGRVLSEAEFSTLVGFFTMVPMLLGIVIGLNVTYAAQATAVEKAEKAFEMLLAQPIPRRSVVLAKMAGAVVASIITGVVYMTGMLLMFSSIEGSAPLPGGEDSRVPSFLLGIVGLSDILVVIAVLVLGLVYSGAIGVVIGAVITDERAAGILSTPVVLLFMGISFAAMFLGIPLNSLTAVLAGTSITLIPLVVVNSVLSGRYELAVISVSTSIAATVFLIALAVYLFNRDVVVLGLSISLRRRTRSS